MSASAQLLLLEETAFRPAVAIGAQDFGGASNHFEARYAVAGKTLAGRVRLTAGYGWGDDLLKGAFGGIEASPIRQVTLVGEYDAERFNGSLRIRPLPERLVARGAPRPTVDVIWTEGEGVTWGVSLRAVLDQDWIEREPAREVGQGPGPAITEPGVDAVDVLARLLAEDGFENVQVSVREGDVLRVEYENRRYNQHELDGLAQVFRIVSRNMPAGAENLRIVVKRTNLRVAQIDVTSADLRHFLDGSIGPEVFRNRVSIRHPGAPRSLAGPASRSVNSSFFKADLTLHPGIETVVYSDFGVADARLFLLPNLRIALFRGTVLEAQYRLPIGQTEGYERAAGPLPDPELDRLLLHHAEWWSLSDRAAFAAQWSVGRFDRANVGIRQEASLSLMGGLLRLGADVAVLGDTRHELDRLLALGSARLFVPAVDTRLTVTAGRFLDEDDGVAVDLARFFADTEIGVFLCHSGEGSIAGIRIAMPLTLGKDLRPGRLRVRTPAEWRYQQQTVVFADQNVLRRDIARGLPPLYGLAQSYLDRDRLHPAAVEASLANPRFWR